MTPAPGKSWSLARDRPTLIVVTSMERDGLLATYDEAHQTIDVTSTKHGDTILVDRIPVGQLDPCEVAAALTECLDETDLPSAPAKYQLPSLVPESSSVWPGGVGDLSP